MNTIILTEMWEKTIAEASILKREVAEKTKLLDLYKKDIVKDLFKNTYGQIIRDSGLIVLEHLSRSRAVLDTKKLEADHPEIYAKYVHQTTYGVLTL